MSKSLRSQIVFVIAGVALLGAFIAGKWTTTCPQPASQNQTVVQVATTPTPTHLRSSEKIADFLLGAINCSRQAQKENWADERLSLCIDLISWAIIDSRDNP